MVLKREEPTIIQNKENKNWKHFVIRNNRQFLSIKRKKEKKPVQGKDSGGHDCHFWFSPIPFHEQISYQGHEIRSVACLSEIFPHQMQHLQMKQQHQQHPLF